MKKNIVVIGAGLAGSLISNELAKKCNVVLLEIGEKNQTSYPDIKFIKKRLAAVKTFCFGGGGSTNLWHNGLIPIQKEDVCSSVFNEVLEDAEQYYNKAAEKLFWLDNPYSQEYTKVVTETALNASKITHFPDGIDCLLYPKRFSKLDTVEEVTDYYSVRDIQFNSDQNKIHSVSFRVGTESVSVDADAVILSSGTLGTPLLVKKALNSLSLPDENVGQGLADHPLGFVGKIKIKKELNAEVSRLSLNDRGNYECRTAIRVKSDCGKYTGCAFLRPALTMTNKLPIYKFKSLLGASAGIDRIKNALSFKILHPDILAEVYSHLLGANIPGRIYNILFLFEQKRGRNSIRYDGSTFEVDWSISEEELEIYRSMIEKLGNILSGVADEINLKTDITEDWLWSAAHHSGTVSLGAGEEGFVNKDLKLNGSDNVYVCDGSVIQEHSYANTGLVIGSLAERLAERISR